MSIIISLLLAAAPVQFAQPRSALEEGRARSLESKTPARLTFVNLTDRELQLDWLDFHGRRRPYGSLPAHGRVTKRTFLTHRWLVATPHGHGLAIFRAQAAQSTVLIDPMAAPKRANEVQAQRSAKGTRTALRFVNPTSKPVQLYWIDYQGQEVPRGTLAPHSALNQPTYSNHVWIVASQDGRDRSAFVAKAAPQTAVVAPRSLDSP